MQLSRKLQNNQRRLIRDVMAGLPLPVRGPVSICALPQLTACQGKLLSGELQRGTPVHAGSFIRQRRIVLETQLLADVPLLRLVLVHELAHFVWPFLGNPVRAEYAGILRVEGEGRARGEIGESSAVRKAALGESASSWKEYVCESFCDTAAWLYAGVADHETFMLGRRWRQNRADWFRKAIER